MGTCLSCTCACVCTSMLREGDHATVAVLRRAAEDDATLTEEEKAVLRFQQQRMKEAASDRS